MTNSIHSPEVGGLYKFISLPGEGKLLLVDVKKLNSFTFKLLFYSLVTNRTFEDVASSDYFYRRYELV